MNISEFLAILKQKKQTVFSIAIVFLVLSAVFIFSQPFKYGAETKLLVVQNTQIGADPYQVNKANEYVADVLADVVVTNSFFNEIANAGFSINRGYFPEGLREQQKAWQKTVKTNASDRGIISINVFHEDKEQADQIIRAVNATLKSKHTLYHGSGEQVSVRVIDQPYVSAYPVKPNIAMNLGLGLVFGLLFAFSYIYLFPERKYNLRLLPMKKRARQVYEYEADDSAPELNLPGVDKNVAYDVREAINKLRQREKQEGQAYAAIRQQGSVNSQNNVQNNYNDDLSYNNDITKQGSMDNVF